MPGVVGLVLLLLGLGVLRFTGCAARQYPLWGIDVSRHQGVIDWAAVAGAGPHFVYIKATEGGDWTDPLFADNWRSPEAAGLLRGAYHFFTFCTPGTAQARHFLATVPPQPGTLPPVVDVELSGNCRNWGDVESVQAELAAFVAAVEAAHRRRPVIYTTYTNHGKFVAGLFEEYPLWLRSVRVPPWWLTRREWVLWQHSDRGTIAGVEGPVDLNVFVGDLAELRSFQASTSD